MENLQSIQQRQSRGEPLDFVFFWGHTPTVAEKVTKVCLSQWYNAPFVIDGIAYPTAEHWMMAGKARLFGDLEALEKILETPSPQNAKDWGRKVRSFDSAHWQAASIPLVIEGNLEKFSQLEHLKHYLLSTSKAILVEASPLDSIWGIGLAGDHPDARFPSRWRGKNLLGFALMEVRDRLRLATQPAR